MLNSIVTVSCLVILVLELAYLIVSFINKTRSQRIEFLRSFKKGKGAVIYITAIPLYFIGIWYAQQIADKPNNDALEAFFKAMNKIVSVVVMRYDTDSIKALMNDYGLYKFTVYFCFILIAVNAVILTLSITHQYLWAAHAEYKVMHRRADKLFIFGNNSASTAIYRSDKHRDKVIVDDISAKDGEKLYMNRVAYISTHSQKEQIAKMLGLVEELDRECIFIINTGDDEKNIMLCNTVAGIIEKASDELKSRMFLGTKVFVFGDPRYEAIYEDIVSGGYGCIHYINKYKEIAMDFIDKYPFSKFMDEKQIDYTTSLIKDGVDINVILIGFGKTNRQLFLTSVANNQFLTAGEGDPELKKVRYHIFDKDKAENNKNLNHSYYRYRNECSDFDPKDYLPLPAEPAWDDFKQLDINDPKFYKEIRSIVTAGKKDVNFAVIAFGTDLENMDMAQKLIGKRKEWGIDNLVIFVKVRSHRKEQTVIEDEGCYFIGHENDVVYNIDKILGDRIYRMAQMRNEVYDLEYGITHSEGVNVDEEYIRKNRDISHRNWYLSKSQMERDSSLYCCLSLRSKLNLMGLDYCEIGANDLPALSEEEYLDIYAGFDMPNVNAYDATANGKKIVNYTLHFPASRRRNMAVHEHQRWNSFMISKGIVPSSREQIASECITKKDGKVRFTNGKNYALRRHGNITTFEGLEEFRRIVSARDKCSELETDVIKYDYQLLDDAYWLLTANGYKIIKNEKLG